MKGKILGRLWLIVAVLAGYVACFSTVIALVVGIGLLPGAKKVLPPGAEDYALCIFLAATLAAISSWQGLYSFERSGPSDVP